jgi:PAS domain S-box-containing protein/diguanylate cyclase (GGDEF)-like protein
MSAFQDPEVYRDILNQLQVGVCVLDLQKRIVFWNDGAEQITGYARIEVLGHVCSENIFLHCNQESCEVSEKCPLPTALRESRAVQAQGFVHHKSGHRIPVHTWSMPLRDKNGSPIGIIQTFDPEFAESDADPKQHSLQQRGWLDEVTGLPDRTIMHSRLRETLATFTELHIPFAIMILGFPEIDQFRTRYGQGAARAIMQVLARTIRNTVWPTDPVGRWGEGRFLVILMNCTEEALHAAASRMLRVMAGAGITWWGEELSLRVVIGRAEARAGDTLELLLQRAQQGLEEGRAPSHSQSTDIAASASVKD